MGRSKQKMELIRNEKLRSMTFQKRMKGFKKKMHEFSTLCDVKAYSVIFGPKQGKDPNGLVEPETWPENKNDVYDFFQQFQNYDQGKQEVGIADFFMNQKKKVRAELNQLREQNDKANNYPTWNERLDQCSLDQLKTLSTELDLKLEHVQQKLDQTQGELDLVEKTMSYFSSPVPDDVKQKLDQTQGELDLVEKAISYFSSPVPDDVYVQVQQQQQQQPLSYVPINFRYGVDCGDNFCPGSTSTLHYIYTPPVIPVAHFHHNSSFLPALDDYEIMFDNSSQAVGGYYIAADPKSSVMGPSQLYYQYHQQQQQQQQQLNEF